MMLSPLLLSSCKQYTPICFQCANFFYVFSDFSCRKLDASTFGPPLAHLLTFRQSRFYVPFRRASTKSTLFSQIFLRKSNYIVYRKSPGFLGHNKITPVYPRLLTIQKVAQFLARPSFTLILATSHEHVFYHQSSFVRTRSRWTEEYH